MEVTYPFTYSIDQPTDAIDQKAVVVRGWAHSEEAPVNRIDILLDGKVLGHAELGLERRDVAHALARPSLIRAGFVYYTTLEMSPGPYRLSVRLHDEAGNIHEGHRTVTLSALDHASPHTVLERSGSRIFALVAHLVNGYSGSRVLTVGHLQLDALRVLALAYGLIGAAPRPEFDAAREAFDGGMWLVLDLDEPAQPLALGEETISTAVLVCDGLTDEQLRNVLPVLHSFMTHCPVGVITAPLEGWPAEAFTDAGFNVLFSGPVEGRQLVIVQRTGMPPPQPAPEEFAAAAFITTRNHRAHLPATLDHLAEQGLPAWVIDRWSSDETRALAAARLGEGGVLGVEVFPPLGEVVMVDASSHIDGLARSLPLNWAFTGQANTRWTSPWPHLTLRDTAYSIFKMGFNKMGGASLRAWQIDAPEGRRFPFAFIPDPPTEGDLLTRLVGF